MEVIMDINISTWTDVFLVIISLFLFCFLFVLLMYVIGKLLGYIDNGKEHIKPTNNKQTKQNNIDSNNK